MRLAGGSPTAEARFVRRRCSSERGVVLDINTLARGSMMNNSRRTLALMVGVAAAVGTACVRPARPPAPTAASGLQCDHGYAVTVRNNTRLEVEIWQSTSTGWVYVDDVLPYSTSELPLQGSGTVQWRWLPQPPRYDPNLSTDVTLHVHCAV